MLMDFINQSIDSLRPLSKYYFILINFPFRLASHSQAVYKTARDSEKFPTCQQQQIANLLKSLFLVCFFSSLKNY